MSTCNWCNESKKICSCRHMPFALKQTFGGKTFYNKLKRGLGVEIEIADWKNLEEAFFHVSKYNDLRIVLNAKKLWDRSVTPSNHELVVGPLYGDSFLSNMSILINILLKEGVTVNDSCAVHTHVDARDVSIWGVRSAILNYMRHEKDFVTMFSCKRIYNNTHRYGGFAKPFSATPHTYAKLQALKNVRTAGQIKNILIDYLYNIKNPSANFIEVVEKKSHKYEPCRYYGFNLHAFMMMGTFEFRQMEGCIDSTLIIWPLFCGHYTQAIIKYSRSTLPFLEFCEQHLPDTFAKWAASRIDKYKDEWKVYNTNQDKQQSDKKSSAARLIRERIPVRQSTEAPSRMPPQPRLFTERQQPQLIEVRTFAEQDLQNTFAGTSNLTPTAQAPIVTTGAGYWQQQLEIRIAAQEDAVERAGDTNNDTPTRDTPT